MSFFGTWLLLLACEPAAPPVDPKLPDVVVVVLDTTRRDRLSLYGHERDTSPNLVSFAKRATTYDRAYSTSSWTAPAHASLFTGLFPATHGTTQTSWDLRDEQETMAEILSAKGYTTLAAVSNPTLVRSRGYAQGFMAYQESWREKGLTTDEVTVGWVEEKLSERGPGPMFLFVNLNGAHSPYDDSCGSRCGTWGVHGTKFGERNDWTRYYLGRRLWTEEGLAHLADLYDDELVEVDRQLGRILAAVESGRKADNTLVIVTADHGEHFGEHGHVDHVFSLHESLVRVPLVIRWPSQTGASRVSAFVQLVDILPTVLGVVEQPSDRLHGVDLATPPPADRGVFLEYARAVQAFQTIEPLARPGDLERIAAHKESRQALIAPSGMKLHRTERGALEVYDLERDPLERNDVSATATTERAVLQARLRRLSSQYRRANSREQGAQPIDEETRAALESLGYLPAREE